MNFLYVEEVIQNIHIDLNILKRESQRHNILLYQHEGVLAASTAGIGGLPGETTKFDAFFTLAGVKNADLVLTPEYSCPWSCIEGIISDKEKWPQINKLWAIGSHSINKDQIRTFEADYLRGKVDIAYHYDRSLLTQIQTFFDPLVYLFRANIGGDEKLTVLIQFKTHHMGIWSGGDIERNNIILGHDIFVIRNSAQSVNLFSLICSEAMNFQDNFSDASMIKLGWVDSPFLILNPQVNPDPLHPLFIAFRNFVFRYGKKEIIHLNWNNQSKIGTRDLLRGNASRSGVYLRSTEIEQKNPRQIKRNHQRGQYYFYYGVDRHAFIFNSGPNAYLIALPPVDITGVLAPQMRRDGPEVLETFAFDAIGGITSLTNVADHHIDYIQGLGCTNQFLNNPDNCVIEKERLVCISSGEMLDKGNRLWFETEHLRSIRMRDTVEVNCRLTFAEDTQPESRQQRAIYIEAVTVLNDQILPNQALFPESIADLKAMQLAIGYSLNEIDNRRVAEEDGFKYNLIDQNGNPVCATVSYVGTADDDKVNGVFYLLQALFDKESMTRRRVVVFYKRGPVIESKSDPDAGNFLATNDYTGPSIFR
jgi:hypothetical protein